MITTTDTTSPVRCLAAVTADPITTYLAVASGAVEVHPLWHAAIASVGAGPAMLLRLALGWVLVLGVAHAVDRPDVPVGPWTLDALTWTFAAVAAWNLLAWTLS